MTYNLVTFFSKVQTHPTLRISDIKSNFFLLSEIIYSYQVGMGFEIEYFKALNPLTLMVKLLLLTLTGDEMFINS